MTLKDFAEKHGLSHGQARQWKARGKIISLNGVLVFAAGVTPSVTQKCDSVTEQAECDSVTVPEPSVTVEAEGQCDGVTVECDSASVTADADRVAWLMARVGELAQQCLDLHALVTARDARVIVLERLLTEETKTTRFQCDELQARLDDLAQTLDGNGAGGNGRGTELDDLQSRLAVLESMAGGVGGGYSARRGGKSNYTGDATKLVPIPTI